MAADGGPLTWLSFLQLPVAGGDWNSLGPVALLPVASVLAWLGYRHLSVDSAPFTFGWPRLTYLGLALALLALGRVGLACADGGCSTGSVARLVILLALGAWTYLYVANERPDLLWVVAPIIVLQSFVGMAQFWSQSDLGWQFLGERALDPTITGISVVWRDDVRWLRAYGLTGHPNVLARTLVPLLLMIPILWQGSSLRRRQLLGLIFVVGIGGMLVTLSRWAWACLLLGLLINTIPYGIRLIRGQTATLARPVPVTIVASVILIVLFLVLYDDTVAGRAVVTSSATEAMSVGERQRDLAIAMQIVEADPLTGVGHEMYVPVARELDPTADVVHMVPLWWAAELGLLGSALWLLILVAPVWRQGILGQNAPFTALWVSFWLLGLLYAGPNPLIELRAALMAGLVAGVMAWSTSPDIWT